MAEMKELLAFIRVREAIGDENGRLMQDEVVDRVRMLVKENVELKKMRNGLQARNTELVLENRELKAKRRGKWRSICE
jgi:hypothetical protein